MQKIKIYFKLRFFTLKISLLWAFRRHFLFAYMSVRYFKGLIVKFFRLTGFMLKFDIIYDMIYYKCNIL